MSVQSPPPPATPPVGVAVIDRSIDPNVMVKEYYRAGPDGEFRPSLVGGTPDPDGDRHATRMCELVREAAGAAPVELFVYGLSRQDPEPATPFGLRTLCVQLLNALESVAKNDAVRVVSISMHLDTPATDPILVGLFNAVLEELASRGKFVVMTAGNSLGEDPVPGEAISLPGVAGPGLTVGGASELGRGDWFKLRCSLSGTSQASGANGRYLPDVYADGVYLKKLTEPDSKEDSGTSYATARVSGQAATHVSVLLGNRPGSLTRAGVDAVRAGRCLSAHNVIDANCPIGRVPCCMP